MALNGKVTADAPTTYGLASDGDRTELELTLPVASGENIKASDLVKLSNGYVAKVSAKNDLVIGMAKTDADNTSGEDGDKKVAVVVRGIITQDALTSSTTYTSILIGNDLYLSPAVSNYCDAGQALTVVSTSATKVGKALDGITQPVNGYSINKVRVLIDLTDRSYAWTT